MWKRFLKLGNSVLRGDEKNMRLSSLLIKVPELITTPRTHELGLCFAPSRMDDRCSQRHYDNATCTTFEFLFSAPSFLVS
jgi:hypothetical protein